MRSRHGSYGLAAAAMGLLAVGVLLLSGCFSFNLGDAMRDRVAPQPQAQPAPQDSQAPPPSDQAQGQAQAQPQSRGAGSAMAYQYQFNAFYSGFWSMGWFGYKDINYKPGQGTVWTFTDSKKAAQVMTLERALLKVNADSSQWWRFRFDQGKETVLYEFLVGPDGVVKKARYKDPDSGTVQEFVPSQDPQQPQAGPPMKSRAEMDKYKVDRQNVTVKAGSYDTDHYLYTDDQANGTSESWVSQSVPGYMVKTIYTSKKRNQTMTGELVQVESGVTTALGSF